MNNNKEIFLVYRLECLTELLELQNKLLSACHGVTFPRF